MKQKRYKNITGFMVRFTLVHVLTYVFFGIAFMLLSRYFDYFAYQRVFYEVMKPSTALTVRLAPLVQIVRGLLLAFALYPSRAGFIGVPSGWIRLFALLFVLTSIGSVITGPGSIEGLLYTYFPFNPLIGYPEIALQMGTFSYVFCKWQGRSQVYCQTDPQ
ncbi:MULTISPECIES: hypothetical protein [Sphaerochaeta]|uniref:Uncharacterized protein n=1 Tax=Sphaerochaeta associata TaxID=1129264 RepID=A0ABY4DCK0_9SPIR|nr:MULTISPECIES: hypothetical protein [Sphaerochaeta]MDD3457526.1 hypothetical protein [Sphaerochaeta sp.]MDD4038933.1 hypothetical protein [Sphaerochaeta sp.]MDX9984519.1 hypothetical protein [Sphaerochaeta sp.]MEA5030487.1 hypothetical protein [Sphaerochaeta associata]MEA5107075.1 hypothetical protein [Sphaerochaeta associata]